MSGWSPFVRTKRPGPAEGERVIERERAELLRKNTSKSLKYSLLSGWTDSRVLWGRASARCGIGLPQDLKLLERLAERHGNT